jgi:hypothetical protein
MQRQQVKNVVSAVAKKSSASIQPAKNRLMPLDTDALKRVVGGASAELPHKGW